MLTHSMLIRASRLNEYIYSHSPKNPYVLMRNLRTHLHLILVLQKTDSQSRLVQFDTQFVTVCHLYVHKSWYSSLEAITLTNQHWPCTCMCTCMTKTSQTSFLALFRKRSRMDVPSNCWTNELCRWLSVWHNIIVNVNCRLMQFDTQFVTVCRLYVHKSWYSSLELYRWLAVRHTTGIIVNINSH